MNNLAAIADAGGTALAAAVRLTVYVTDMGDFASVNEAYAKFFEGDPPARAAIGVTALPRGAQVAADAVVALP
jgi:2-iminobutanoate/2-iminopropanoate deaminase